MLQGSTQSMFLARASKMRDLKALASDMWGLIYLQGT